MVGLFRIFRWLAFVFLFSLPCWPRAQFKPWMQFRDNIQTAFQSKPKFFLGFDSKHSFISNAQVKLFGIRAGLDFNKRVRLGLGFYGLSSPFYRTFILANDTLGPDTISSQLSFSYFSAFAEYVFFKSKRWELSIPFHLGLGGSEFLRVPATKGGNLLTEVSVTGHYKIIPWFGLGGGVGYRQLLISNRYLSESFNAPVYNFQIKLFLGELYRRIVHKERQEAP